MASKVDMSLDDIIKSNKAGRGRGRGRGRGSISRSPRGRGIVRGASRGRARGRARGSLRSDSALRQIQTGRIGKSPRGGLSTGSISTRWEHDRFEGGQGSRNRRGGSTASRSAVKLVISNLDFGVNDQDLKELFGEFGGFVKASVHYDISGRSNGTAFIIMNSAEAAEQAKKRYHGVQLDGRPMDIQIMGGNVASTRAPLAERFTTPRGRGARGVSRGGSGSGRGRGRGGRGGRGRGGPTPSKKELDEQLDMYNSQTD